MIAAKAYAARSATTPLEPYRLRRRDPRPDDVVVRIDYCGICHSDIHTARSEWGPTAYPCVPGHEIVGTVVATGTRARRFKPGDLAGVGCFVDSCGTCAACRAGEEQFCRTHTAFTYNCTELDRTTPTQGGYATHIVVREKYAFRIRPGVPLARVAPLLCAGITTYSPLKRHGVGRRHRVGVVGLGGLGHMAVKFATALGAHVTVCSRSPGKQRDARRLGADAFVLSTKAANLAALAGTLDFVIDTVSAQHDLTPYLAALKNDATMVLVGASPQPNEVMPTPLIMGRRRLTGSLIGGLRETQEMLDFCFRKKIYCDIELIPAQRINEAYERTIKGDVKYRFVIDAATF